MHRKIRLTSVFLILFSISYSQTPIDSLKNRLVQLRTNDSSIYTVTKTIESIAVAFEKNYQFDSAKQYHDLHLQLVSTIDDFKSKASRDSAVGKVYINLSFMELSKQQNAKALAYADSSISLLNSYANQPLILRALNNKAVALNNLGSFKDAIDILIKILDDSRNLEDTEYANHLQQNALINIGKNYISLQHWSLAIDYSKRALSIQTNNQRSEAIIFMNLSAIYLEIENLDSAVFYAKKCKTIAQEMNNGFFEVNALLNEASALEKLYKLEDALKATNEIISKSLEINHIAGFALGLALKGTIFAKQEKHEQAIDIFKEAVTLGKKYEDYEYLEDCYESMSETYARMRDFDKAYEFYQLYDQINDSLRNETTQKSHNDILIKYETAQKEQQLTEKELEVQTKEATIANQQNVIILVSSSMGFILLIGLIIYNRNQAIQKQKLSEAVLAEKEKGYSSIITATEQERNRISKDLHDGIGQELSALKLAIKAVSEKETDVKQKKELEEIANTFSKSADEVRNISHQMMPRALMENGLMPAIDDLLKNAFRHSQTLYTLEESGISERFEERIEVSVYRIIQELINNIIKHAEATQVSVQLIAKSNQLLVFVEDDGKGFNETSKNEGHGLVNIKSRVEMINGSVNFEPSSSKGTFVSLAIPIDNHA